MRFDVIGVGANSVDYVYRLPAFPRPDSPVAKVRISSYAVRCGGQTATALCTCAAMGLRAKYVGTTGNNGSGKRMRSELERRGVNVEHAYVRDAGNPFAVILLDEQDGERVVLWDRSEKLQLHNVEVEAALAEVPRALHVDDTDEDAAIRAAILGRASGIPVTSDIERVTERTEALVAAVTIPIFAEHVLEPLTGEHDVERALRAVQQRRGRQEARLKPDTTHEPEIASEHDMVCVTLGAGGAMLLDGDRLHYAPAVPVHVVDTTGAGDVFRGAFITALLRGDSPAEILRFANAAAAISCTRLGAIEGVPTIEETEAVGGRR